MSFLHFDDCEGRYVGQHLAVEASAYADAVDGLVESGMDTLAALVKLLFESEWSPEMAGVELRLSAEFALDEAARILSGRL